MNTGAAVGYEFGGGRGYAGTVLCSGQWIKGSNQGYQYQN